MVTKNFKIDFSKENKFEKILNFLKIENFEKYETFYCDKVYEINGTESQIKQLDELLSIVF